MPDGRSLRMLVNAIPICSESGDFDSVVVTMQDLAALEEFERLRVEFLGVVSHELRGPLAAIKGSAATLLEEAGRLDVAEMQESHRIIVYQAGRMRRLVGNLLDTVRIESGTLSVDPEPLELPVPVEQARTTFLTSGVRQEIRIDLPADLPLVMADERRIVRVLSNLTSNAGRHAPDSWPMY